MKTDFAPRCYELAHQYEVSVVPDPYMGYRGLIPAFPGESGVGETPEAALASAYERLVLVIDWHLEDHLPLPPVYQSAAEAA